MMDKISLDGDIDEEIRMDILRGRNLLVLTTKCNLNCVFCSRKFNPFTSKFVHRKYSDIKAQLDLFRPDQMISINNSVSRLTDGEPFSHPRIWDILKHIRVKFPFSYTSPFEGRIKITTNGTYLTKENLRKLSLLKGVSMIHSINSTNLEDWMRIHRATNDMGKTSIEIPKIIKKYGIEYVASVVALPNILGWEAVKSTLEDLDSCGVELARVFLPTYTKYTSEKEQEPLNCDESKFEQVMNKLQKELKMHLLIYPSKFEDVDPKLRGYEDVGIQPTDEILSINNKKVFCRKQAVNFLYENRRSFVVKLRTKEGEEKKLHIISRMLNSKPYTRCSINDDIDFDIMTIEKITKNHKRILVMPSEAGEEIVKASFQKSQTWSNFLGQKDFYYKVVYNDFYGGNVRCAGLLMSSDYKKYLEEFIDKNFKLDLVLISKSSFDLSGRDLLKNSIYDMGKDLGVNIALV